MKKLLTLAALLSVALPAGAAMGESADYTGNWPVTITGSRSFNGSHCVALFNGGDAQLDGTYDGAYQVIGRTMLVFLDITGSGDEPATLLFSSPARNGTIGKGAFDNIQGGTTYDSGKEVFGTKGGC